MLKNDLVMSNTQLNEVYSQLETHCYDMAKLVDCIGNSLFVIDILAEMNIEDREILQKILDQINLIRTTLEGIENNWGTSKMFKDKMLEYLLENDPKL